MARTQAADYEQRQNAIVDHAAALFARHGFTGASVADLANACETSKSLIYHYFPSKEDILYAVMTSHIDQLVEDVEEVTRRDIPPADQFNDLVHAFLHHYLGAADRQKVLLNDLGHLPAEGRAAIIAKQRKVIDAVQALLVVLHPELATDTSRARVQTMLIFGMLNWTHVWYRPNGPIGVDQLANMIVNTALK